MFTGPVIKGIGIAATAIGIGASLVSSWVEDKKMDDKIEEKVNEVLTKKEKEIES